MDHPPPPRIGSLCTGYGGLDEAVRQVFGGTVAWHCQYEPPDKDGREDKNQYAARILAHHWPKIPNHGDLTRVDWSAVEPVDILTAGFPCQDVSLAGLRAGLSAGTRSGLWLHVARAIEALQPRLVVIENVRGLLSAPADRGLGLEAEALEEEARAGRVLRALGAVLGDLARLGFDAEWACVRASEVGAPHQRERVFLLAWPADTEGAGRPRPGVRGRSAERSSAVADADGVGGERGRACGGRRDEPAAHDFAATHAQGVGEREPADEAVAVAGSRDARKVPGGRGRTPVADTGGVGRGAAERHVQPGQSDAVRGPAADADRRGFAWDAERHCGPEGAQPERALGLDADRRDVQRGPRVGTAADAEGDGWDEGRTESAGQQGGSDAPLGGVADVQWGEYEPAVRRWEQILGRPAPRPTDDRGRLSPAFVEWMQGLAAGHVTSVPGIPRGAQLKALGNGVVPQQAQAAVRLLYARACGTAA